MGLSGGGGNRQPDNRHEILQNHSNRKAFSVVRVPTAEEERKRAISRQRQQLQALGRSLLAMYGIHVSGK